MKKIFCTFDQSSSARNEDEIGVLAETLANQSFSKCEVHLFAKGKASNRAVRLLRDTNKGLNVTVWKTGDGPRKTYREFLDNTAAEYVCHLGTEAMYGEGYLEEAAMFFRLPMVNIIGKGCHYRASEKGAVSLTDETKENRMVSAVPADSVAVRKSVLTPDMLHGLLNEKAFVADDDGIFSTYRYGYIQRPSPGAEIDDNKWILKSGDGE
ncbi:hypothetical protein ACFL1X_12695 [Candidatus Hydrogenedentota bacterium]